MFWLVRISFTELIELQMLLKERKEKRGRQEGGRKIEGDSEANAIYAFEKGSLVSA